jgi:hypothetical protein
MMHGQTCYETHAGDVMHLTMVFPVVSIDATCPNATLNHRKKKPPISC